MPDILLDGFTELFQELNAVVNVLVFSLVESRDVGMNVVVVEEGCAFLHFIYQDQYIYNRAKEALSNICPHMQYSLIKKEWIRYSFASVLNLY